MLTDFYYSNPSWLVGALVIGLTTGVSILGLVGFNAVVSAEKREKDNKTVGLTYAIVAVILAVLVAVIVVDVWETAAKAREITAGEANQLSSLAMQSGGLQPAMAQTVRGDVDQYIELVEKREWPSQLAGKVGEAVYASGWAVVGDLTARLAAYEPSGLGENAVKADMLRTLDALIKARRDRMLAASDHTPDDVWIMLNQDVAAFQPQTPGQASLKQAMLGNVDELSGDRRARILAVGEHLPDAVWEMIVFGLGLVIVYLALFGPFRRWMHFTTMGLSMLSIGLVLWLIVELDYPFRSDNSVDDDAYLGVKNMTAALVVPATPAPAAAATPEEP